MTLIRHLYLIRHAETFEKEPHQSDLERGLTFKGKSDAEKLGLFLKNKRLYFDQLITSAAVRAQTTAAIIANSISYPLNSISVNPQMHHAGLRELATIVSQSQDNCFHLAIIGHNPTISHFASNLTLHSVENFSPCTIAAFEMELDNWTSFSMGKATFKFVQSPPIL